MLLRQPRSRPVRQRKQPATLNLGIWPCAQASWRYRSPAARRQSVRRESPCWQRCRGELHEPRRSCRNAGPTTGCHGSLRYRQGAQATLGHFVRYGRQRCRQAAYGGHAAAGGEQHQDLRRRHGPAPVGTRPRRPRRPHRSVAHAPIERASLGRGIPNGQDFGPPASEPQRRAERPCRRPSLFRDRPSRAGAFLDARGASPPRGPIFATLERGRPPLPLFRYRLHPAGRHHRAYLGRDAGSHGSAPDVIRLARPHFDLVGDRGTPAGRNRAPSAPVSR